MNKKYLLGALVLLAVTTAIIAGVTGKSSQNLTANLLGNNSKNLVAVTAAESDWEKCGKFNDVTPADSYCSLTRLMRDRHIFTGDANGNFRANDPVSRAEFAKILVTALYGLNVNVENSNSLNGADLGFKDLGGTHWAYPYLKIAKQKGLIKGYPDGTFKMTNLVSRAEFAKMIYSQLPDIYKKMQAAKSAVLSEPQWQYPNVYTMLDFKADQWYSDYLLMLIYANDQGVLLDTCVKDGRVKICPERPITRLEIAYALQHLTTDYQLTIGYGEGDSAVTGAITADNCAKIYKLSNITATLQDLGLNANDIIGKCVNAYPQGQTQPTHPAANDSGVTGDLTAANCLKISRLSNITATLQSLNISGDLPYQCARTFPSIWQKCQTMWNWKRAGGNNGLSQNMSSNNPPFTSADAAACARQYGNIWNYEINDEVSSSNCQKIRNLSNITATLQMLGINLDVMPLCANAYPGIWSPGQPQQPYNPTGITGNLDAENCLKITRLTNMTATLQSLGISTNLMSQCNQTYWSVWNKCSTLWSWKKANGATGLSQLMSSNNPPFTSEDASFCANQMGQIWHYEINDEVSLNNCMKIRRLPNYTAVLQMLGIDLGVMSQCANAFQYNWDHPNG